MIDFLALPVPLVDELSLSLEGQCLQRGWRGSRQRMKTHTTMRYTAKHASGLTYTE